MTYLFGTTLEFIAGFITGFISAFILLRWSYNATRHKLNKNIIDKHNETS